MTRTIDTTLRRLVGELLDDPPRATVEEPPPPLFTRLRSGLSAALRMRIVRTFR